MVLANIHTNSCADKKSAIHYESIRTDNSGETRRFVKFLHIFPIFAVLTGLLFSIARAESVDWSATPYRLMLVEQDGCVYSAAWHREIGQSYPGSEAGQAAPLLRVSINGPYPNGIALARRPNVTPTFILLRNGQELSRIEGYPGAAQFYPMFQEMLRSTGLLRK